LIAVLSGVLSAVALGVSAQHAFAAITWGSFGAYKPAGTNSQCLIEWQGEKQGEAAVNGNDNGQVIAACYDGGNWTCGTTLGHYTYWVRGEGHNMSSNQKELTGASNGPSANSTAGGYRIDETHCQDGWTYQ
jgi:hypothetical protein